jgi:hypothetical protein
LTRQLRSWTHRNQCDPSIASLALFACVSDMTLFFVDWVSGPLSGATVGRTSITSMLYGQIPGFNKIQYAHVSVSFEGKRLAESPE